MYFRSHVHEFGITASCFLISHQLTVLFVLYSFIYRLEHDLSRVNDCLTRSLTEEGHDRTSLKKQRSALEDQLEDMASVQRTLQLQLGNSGTNSSSGKNMCNAASYAGSVNMQGNSAAGAGDGVIDLCSANKPYTSNNNTYNNNNSYTAPYALQSGGSAVNNTTSSYFNGNSQLSPQLAAMARLAGVTVGNSTPVANYNNNSNSSANNNYGGNNNAANYPNYNGNNNNYQQNQYNNNTSSSGSNSYSDNGPGAGLFGTSSGGYTSHNMNTTTANRNTNTYNSNNGNTYYNQANSSAIPTSKKTSIFGQDEFEADFEDAVNNNDFTDWAGASYTPGEDVERVTYQGFVGTTSNNYNNSGDRGNNGMNGGNNYNFGYNDNYNNNNNTNYNNSSADYNNNPYNNANYTNPYLNTTSVNIPDCNCNQPCILLTSRTSATNGLKFYSCANPRGTDANCGFFQWEDPSQVPEGLNNGYNDTNRNENNANMVAKDHKIEIRERFGHVGFRHGQLECVENAMRGKDVFCLMPTGGGKSVVYQVRNVFMIYENTMRNYFCAEGHVCADNSCVLSRELEKVVQYSYITSCRIIVPFVLSLFFLYILILSYLRGAVLV